MRHVRIPVRSRPQAHSHRWQSSSLDPSKDQWEFDGSERQHHGGFSATPARPAPLLPRRAGRVLREVIYQSNEAGELRHLAFARGTGRVAKPCLPRECSALCTNAFWITPVRIRMSVRLDVI